MQKPMWAAYRTLNALTPSTRVDNNSIISAWSNEGDELEYVTRRPSEHFWWALRLFSLDDSLVENVCINLERKTNQVYQVSVIHFPLNHGDSLISPFSEFN